MKYFIKVSELESGNLCYVVTHYSSKVFCRCKDMIIAEVICNVLNFPHKRTKYLYALCLVGNGVLHNDFLTEHNLKKVAKNWLKEKLDEVLLKYEKDKMQ